MLHMFSIIYIKTQPSTQQLTFVKLWCQHTIAEWCSRHSSSKLLHCTQCTMQKNVDCMHRTHNGAFRLQKC